MMCGSSTCRSVVVISELPSADVEAHNLGPCESPRKVAWTDFHSVAEAEVNSISFIVWTINDVDINDLQVSSVIATAKDQSVEVDTVRIANSARTGYVTILEKGSVTRGSVKS